MDALGEYLVKTQAEVAHIRSTANDLINQSTRLQLEAMRLHADADELERVMELRRLAQR